eukprot:9178142-Prorocentrum_lima.AAC.1
MVYSATQYEGGQGGGMEAGDEKEAGRQGGTDGENQGDVGWKCRSDVAWARGGAGDLPAPPFPPLMLLPHTCPVLRVEGRW